MKGENFTVVIRVDRSPQEVYDAVNDVRSWWSGEIDGPTDRLGGVWTYRYQDLHRSTQKVTTLEPGKKVVWHVEDADLSFVKDRKEWNGTDIVFDIAKKGGQTELRFTHVGLRPTIQCYGDCSGAWTFYIQDSLQKRIVNGKGSPNPKERKSKKK
jgi:Activator of Hsp90 ATPase homolog 1-like protein